MIKLRRMTQKEYDDYYPKALQHLADEMAKARGASSEEMLEPARKSFKTLLPGGNIETPDQYLYNIIAEDEKIGVLWFGIRRNQTASEAFIWDIEIRAESRGKGFGKQTMLALEDEVKKLGISRISLNVFGHNETAKNLYEQLGYGTVSRAMLKLL